MTDPKNPATPAPTETPPCPSPLAPLPPSAAVAEMPTDAMLIAARAKLKEWGGTGFGAWYDDQEGEESVLSLAQFIASQVAASKNSDPKGQSEAPRPVQPEAAPTEGLGKPSARDAEWADALQEVMGATGSSLAINTKGGEKLAALYAEARQWERAQSAPTETPAGPRCTIGVEWHDGVSACNERLPCNTHAAPAGPVQPTPRPEGETVAPSAPEEETAKTCENCGLPRREGATDCGVALCYVGWSGWRGCEPLHVEGTCAKRTIARLRAEAAALLAETVRLRRRAERAEVERAEFAGAIQSNREIAEEANRQRLLFATEAAAQTARVAELAAEKIALKEEIDAGREVFTSHLLKYEEMVRQRDEAVEAMRWQAKSGGKQ